MGVDVRAAVVGVDDVRMRHRPADLGGVRAAVVAAAGADTSVLVRGGGTKLSWGARPSSHRGWTLVDTGGLDALVDHDPGDMTATVQAGMPLEALQRRLAEAGQHLAVDPPARDAASTVGGIYVANDAGPRRFAYGGVRDLVIGTTTVLADGTVSRSGGQVIKNVAGYDLGKLWCGSLGTLGLVVEMTVRLHPLPEASRTLRIPADAAAATSFVADLLASPVECAAIEWARPVSPSALIMGDDSQNHPRKLRSPMINAEEKADDGGALLVRLEGRAAGLAARVDQLAAVARRAGLSAEPADDESRWEAWRDAHAGSPGTTVARAATLPSELAAVADALAQAVGRAEGDEAVGRTGAKVVGADRIGAAGVAAELRSHAGLGLHDAIIHGDVAAQAAVVAAWREAVWAVGGSVVVRDRPESLDAHVDPWGDPGSDRLQELNRSVKQALDPDGRFAPGRFVGGL